MTSPNTQPIRFFHQGQIVEVSNTSTTRTVLDWLREDAHCTGTKEGCNEGDCGACTVVIGTLNPNMADTTDATGVANPPTTPAGLQLQTVNACIQFLPTLHGKALFTVEDLKAQTANRALHPVQQALVDCHGSQCGFCTPGFVMSLWATYEHHQTCGTRPSRQQLADALSGNLCRCTGYRPILDAGQRMFDLPAVALNMQPAVQALHTLHQQQTDATFHYTDGAAARFAAPRTLPALAALVAERPQARLVAGSTDVGLWVNKQHKTLNDIIYVGHVSDLQVVEMRGDVLYIGAGASLEAAWSALAQRWPSLTDVWLRFASPPIRHAGTMGGNVANGSPIGDAPPVLMALDAQIELRQGERVRRMPLDAFYLDYMKNQLEPGEFVQGLLVPTSDAAHPANAVNTTPSTARHVRAYKISKRFDCDISALCAGFSITLHDGKVADIRLAFGGMAATVRRAAQAEAALRGQVWDAHAVAAAQAALAHDFAPLSDMRASAAYRMQVAQNLLERLWLETRSTAPLPAQATSVWNVMRV